MAGGAVFKRKVAELVAVAQHECVDCGVRTTPCNTKLDDSGCPSYGLTPGTLVMYLVMGRICRAAGIPKACGGLLCVGCIETGLGRGLLGDDFEFVDNGYNIPGYSTPRLRARMWLDPVANVDLEGVA